MADSFSITEVVNQVAVQELTTAMVVLRDTETGPQPATASNQ